MGIELCLFEEGFSIKLFRWFLELRFLNRWAYDPHEIMESWGATIHFRDHYVSFHWGQHYKHWYPFGDWTHVRHDVMQPDGTMVKCKPSYMLKEGDEGDGRWQATYPYHYCLRNWAIQERTATVHVEEREWRWKIFGFVLPRPRRVSRSIYVEFSDEVGDESGSWKGGCIGCGYSLRPNETPLECLRRMERERKF